MEAEKIEFFRNVLIEEMKSLLGEADKTVKTACRNYRINTECFRRGRVNFNVKILKDIGFQINMKIIVAYVFGYY